MLLTNTITNSTENIQSSVFASGGTKGFITCELVEVNALKSQVQDLGTK
jgi:hypothetical protein